MALPDNENRPKVEMRYNPDTPENALRRAEKLKKYIKELEKSQIVSQEEMRKIEFLPIDQSKLPTKFDFEDY